jgi:NitT/TauT family transport system permease protein
LRSKSPTTCDGRSAAMATSDSVVSSDEQRALESALDALESPSPSPPRVGLGRRLSTSVLPPVVAFIAFLGAWQLAYVAEIKPPYALPSPADAWDTLRELVSSGQAWDSTWISVSRGVTGFIASVVIGTLLGLLMSQVLFVRRAIGPYISGLQSLPSVAWVPAAIIWFGLSDGAIYAVILLGAVPSIANGLLSGFDQVPPLYGKVGRVLGFGRVGIVRHVLLPASLPGYVSGLKQGWAFAWRSLMAAELITYSPALGLGLGQLLNLGRELQQMDVVIVSIFLILLVGVAIELLVFAPVERKILKQRGLTGTRR